MLEANARAISAGRWPDEAEKTAVCPDGFGSKLRVVWCFLSRVTFGIAVFYPFYSTLQQLQRLIFPSGEAFLSALIGVAGIVAYVLFWSTSSDEDGWLITVGIPVALSLILGLVRAWTSF
jgi:hypothetical protein